MTGLYTPLAPELLQALITDDCAIPVDTNAASGPLTKRLFFDTLRDWIADVVAPTGYAYPVGAAANGISNDAAVMLTALQSGKVVNGLGKTYGIAGNLRPTSFKGLINCKIIQLTPTIANCRTLTIDTIDSWYVSNVEIDCGGDHATGDVNNNMGFRAQTCNDFTVDKLVVRNGGPISGAFFNACTKFSISRSIVRDFVYNKTPDPTDDCIQGIWCANCSNFRIYDTRVANLTGFLLGVPSVKFTRGIALGGCFDYQIFGNHIDHVNQGIDTSGSVSNHDAIYSGNVLDDLGTWGLKFANYGRDIIVANNIVRRAGAGAYVVSGYAPPPTSDLPSNILFSGDKAYDTGSNGLFGTPRAYSVLAQTGIGPTGIRFVNCEAIDEQLVPTMAEGFFSDVTPGTGADLNQCINCTSKGHTSLAFNGITNITGIDQSAVAITGGTIIVSLATVNQLTVPQKIIKPRGNLVVVNGANNNLVPAAVFTRLTGPTGAFSISGFTGGGDGDEIVVCNTVAQTMTIKQLTGSSAGNQIQTTTGADVVVVGPSLHGFIHDGANNFWRMKY